MNQQSKTTYIRDIGFLQISRLIILNSSCDKLTAKRADFSPNHTNKSVRQSKMYTFLLLSRMCTSSCCGTPKKPCPNAPGEGGA